MNEEKAGKNVESIHALLTELLRILESQRETNWIRGIKAALRELNDGGRGDSVVGFNNAKSIYRTMTSGARGFAEYCIWNSDKRTRIDLNRRLDEIRDDLWSELKF